MDLTVLEVHVEDDRRLRIVRELHVDRRPVERRLPPFRVAGDVARMRLVLIEIEPGEERGVEQRRRHLGDSPPKSSFICPSEITPAALYPLAAVRWPRVSLRENCSPGCSTVPETFFEATRRLLSRLGSEL